MSMSSSAPAAKRIADRLSEPAPFPYQEAEATSATGGVEDMAARESRGQQQLTEAFATGRQQGALEARAEMNAALLREREQIAGSLAQFAAERDSYYRRI